MHRFSVAFFVEVQEIKTKTVHLQPKNLSIPIIFGLLKKKDTNFGKIKL